MPAQPTEWPRNTAQRRIARLWLSAWAVVLLVPWFVQAQSDPRRTPIVEAVQRVRGSVVNIQSERYAQANPPGEMLPFSPSQNRINGMGTGIVIDPRGYLITNNHVVEDVHSLRVELSDGTSHTARVLGRNPEFDLALLKIDTAKPLPVITFGTATDLLVGEQVIAIGNAYGYKHTVSLGIVSALGRDVNLNKEVSYRSLIQTDASINPGNSGGPLLNIHGELVGVNVAIRAGAQNIAFALPIDSVLKTAAALMSGKRKADMGFDLQTRDIVDTSKHPVTRGLQVVADEGSFKAGDLITQVDGKPILCRLDLECALVEKNAGEKAEFAVRREGKLADTVLTSTAASPMTKFSIALQSLSRSAPTVSDQVWRVLGLRLAPAPLEPILRVNPQLHGGLTITEVNPESPSGRAGLQKGDVLVGLHSWETINLDNVRYVVEHPDRASFQPLKFYLIRNGQIRKGHLSGLE